MSDSESGRSLRPRPGKDTLKSKSASRKPVTNFKDAKTQTVTIYKTQSSQTETQPPIIEARPLSKHFCTLCLLVSVFVSVAIGIFHTDLFQLSESEKKDLLKTGMLELHLEFPDVSKEIKFRLSSSADWILTKEEPRHPSSIVALLPSESTSEKPSVTEQLVEKYAVVVNKIFSKILKINPVPVFHMDRSYFDKINGRLSIVMEDLEEYFANGGRSVVVRDIDKILTDKELMVFHALCDDTMAIQKRALVIFLVSVPNPVTSDISWNEENAKQIAYTTLDQTWSSVLSPNFRAALIVRILRESILTEI